MRAQHIWLGTDNTVSNPAGHFLTTSTGAYLSTGGTWTNSSDVNRKEDFREMDGETVLAKIARMPIQSWSYKTEAGRVRHVGPTAQDFHAAFGLGDSDEAIATVDADGINLLATDGAGAILDGDIVTGGRPSHVMVAAPPTGDLSSSTVALAQIFPTRRQALARGWRSATDPIEDASRRAGSDQEGALDVEADRYPSHARKVKADKRGGGAGSRTTRSAR